MPTPSLITDLPGNLENRLNTGILASLKLKTPLMNFPISSMSQGIYSWVNTQNGKVYVGSGQDLERRKVEHLRFLNTGTHSNLHLQAAWNLYGATAFEFVVIELIEDLLWLRARESAWILRLQANNPAHGYNTTGDGWSPSPTTPEARAALRRAWIGRKAKYGMPTGMVAHNFQKGNVPSNKGKTYKFKNSAHKASWTPERRAAQAERARKQLESRGNPATPGRSLSESHKANLRAAWALRKMQATKGVVVSQTI